MIEKYHRLERLEKEKTTNSLKKALGIAALGITLVTAVAVGANRSNPNLKYSDETKKYEVQEYDGINNATMMVNRNPNEVPYQMVTDHIKNMPENAEVLKDGLQPGEELVIPVSVELKH